VPLQVGTRLAGLEIEFHPSGVRGQHYEVIVNGRPVAKGVLKNADTQVAIDLSNIIETTELIIEVLSTRILKSAGERERGVPLSSLTLRREVSAAPRDAMAPQVLMSRHAKDGPWYMDDTKIFEDVFRNIGTLERLLITGGEPLINDRVAEMLEYLVQRKACEHIDLELSTNCTHIDTTAIERFRKFRNISLYLSLDGIGETYEYIRYPARWSTVEANVRKLREMLGRSCIVTPVIQIYTILGLPDVCRFADSLDLEVGTNVLYYPSRLSVHTLPPKARKFAAAKLLEYHDTNCRVGQKAFVLWLAQYLDRATTPPDPNLIREFMVFTNDLDVTRQQ